MGTKTVLKLVAGATALAMSAHGFAATTAADSTGTIFLNINDISTGSSYLFDTGLPVLSFTGTGSGTIYSRSIASDANYLSFVASEASSSDVIEYSVVGGAGTATQTPFKYVVDATGGASAPSAVKGVATNTAWKQINNFLSIGNTAGASTFIPSSNTTNSWYGSGDEANLNSALQLTDSNAIGSALSFYQEETNNPGSSTVTSTLNTFLGTWLLSSGGALTYSVAAAPVPLPAPVVLLFSSLGLLGLIARRSRSSMPSGVAA